MACRSIALLAGFLTLAGALMAGTIYVDPGGSGDAVTIKDGLFMTIVGDTVLVACGTYEEYGLPVWQGRTILSETGDPECVTIDGEGLNRVFEVQSSANLTSRIEGLTIQGGYKSSSGGGAMFCSRPITIHNCVFRNSYSVQSGGAIYISAADPVISSCSFEDNTCNGSGGAIYMYQSSPQITQCSFKRNISTFGGAICVSDASPTIDYCTFSGDSSSSVGAGLACRSAATVTLSHCTFRAERPRFAARAAIHLDDASAVTMENCIVAFTSPGMALRCDDEASTATLSCCDINGNAGGDWVDCIADQASINGNFSQDPQFCGPTAEEFSVESASPCLPGHHPTEYNCGSFIGAVGQGCLGGEATEPATWGAIKATYK